MSTHTLPMAYVGDSRFRDSALFPSIKLLPRNAVLAALHGYRATISHAYGDVCKYYPSCSAYAVGSVQRHGAIKGMGLAMARIARCHPWAAGGEDDVPQPRTFPYGLTPHGFVSARED